MATSIATVLPYCGLPATLSCADLLLLLHPASAAMWLPRLSKAESCEGHCGCGGGFLPLLDTLQHHTHGGHTSFRQWTKHHRLWSTKLSGESHDNNLLGGLPPLQPQSNPVWLCGCKVPSSAPAFPEVSRLQGENHCQAQQQEKLHLV